MEVKELAPNTPVIIGVGFDQEHDEDPTASSEACRLMVNAVRAAAMDAGATDSNSAELLGQIESVAVPQGLWQYRNPGKLVAEAVGCPDAKSILSDLGVLQMTPLNDLCRAIARGEQQLGVVTGGEAKFRELRSQITGQPVTDTHQAEDTPAPDVHYTSNDPFCSDLEAARGFGSPVELFAVIESALRFEQGLGVDEHRDVVANLYSGFSDIAAANPRAWRQESVPAADIRNPTGKNSMLAFPYTKRHSSQWNVNRAVAILVCSVGKARELGLSPERWIFPVSAAESHHVVVLAQQKKLHSHLGTIVSSRRACEMAGVDKKEVRAAELYSCFPAAVRSFAYDLELQADCPLSVTGAMPFSGGPFNHSSLDGVARMVEVLRGSDKGNASEPRFGLVTNLSGIFGKQGCALFSNRPNPAGYAFEDVTGQVAAEDRPVPIDEGYIGPATIAGYTVVFQRETPSHALAICDVPGGKRTVVRTENPALLQAMTSEEYCGRTIEVMSDGDFSLAG